VLGGFLALCSAATFAFNNASVRRAVLTGSIVQGMAITVPIGVPLFFVAALVTGNLAAVFAFSPSALAALVGAGVMHFLWGRYCNYRATRAMGTNLVAPVQQVNLLVTLVLAVWLLGEYLTPLKILGIGLILLGPTLTFQKKTPVGERAVSEEKITSIDAEKPAAFKPNYAEGYTFSLLSAIGHGSSPILVRIGLENTGLGVALAGGLVAYVAATVLFALVLLWPGQWRHVWSTDREAAKWFTFSGILVFFSQMFLYMAMAIAPVTVVAPINRLSMLFRLYFSRLLNPKHEVFGSSVILATVVSLAGAVLLTLSVDLVQSLIALPDGVVAMLNWRWP
jgi:drug/metabolite transporter (DMT)-like permease